MVATRRLISPERTIDIDYDALVRDPIECVVQTHSGLGLEVTDEHLARMDAWLANKNQYDPRRGA